jgi:hypothetical protein
MSAPGRRREGSQDPFPVSDDSLVLFGAKVSQ